MLKILFKDGENVIGLRLTGVIRSQDYQRIMPELERILAAQRPTGFLLDWRDLEGWSAEAETDAFMARILHRRTFERVSIVGAERWRAEAATVGQILDCEVCYFEPADEPAAWVWLQED